MPFAPQRAALVIAATGLLAVASAALGAAKLPLYTRLGGEPVMRQVVSEYVEQLATDPRTNSSFKGTDLKRVKRLLLEQICDISGGGCTYSGDSMREVHEGHGITQAQFYDAVQMLRDAMGRHHVPLSARNELLRLLAPMSHDIIEVPSPPKPPAAAP